MENSFTLWKIANAFRASVTDHRELSDAVVKNQIKKFGDREVRNDEMVIREAAGRLAIAEPEAVRRVHLPISSARGELNEHVKRFWKRS